MLVQKEYTAKKREFIKTNSLTNDSVYHYLSSSQISVIRQYYELYTKYLFNRLMGSLRLDVSTSKADKLVNMKGEGNWEFAGMQDLLVKGAAMCELGHPLRYIYIAKNTINNEKLYFGSRCVGDFFDLSPLGVQSLLKVKDEMFVELKDIVAIKSLNLNCEHLSYDCLEIGLLYKSVGLAGLQKLSNLNPLMSIIVDFLKNDLPLPKSLISEVLNYKSDLVSKLEDFDFLGINGSGLSKLKSSEISLISHMFTHSEQDVLKNIKDGNTQLLSNFFNFRTVSDLNVQISVWSSRNDRLLKAQTYFRSLGISSDWLSIYKYMVKNTFNRHTPMFYYGVELLMLFDKDISIEYSFYTPKDYSYKGYSLSSVVPDMFDTVIDYLATKDFIMPLKEVQAALTVILKEETELSETNAKMMDYLRTNLPLSKYSDLRGILGVYDIVCKKKLEFDSMSEKQQDYVKNKYKDMQNLDAKDTKAKTVVKDCVVDSDINRRYALKEKPDIFAKIQRLQEECSTGLSHYVSDVIQTVMLNKWISDKQILCIDDAFSTLILKEPPIVKAPIGLSINPLGVQKWSLLERSDIKEKILELQRHSCFVDLPQGVRNILTNVLKYNSVSDSQITAIENTYRRHLG